MSKHNLKNQSERYAINESSVCLGHSGNLTPCHEFTGPLNAEGYGQTTIDNKNIGAHRAAYIHKHGHIPAGKEIGHMCHNRKCINPDHLEAVTRSENVIASYKSNSNRKPNNVLDEETRKEIYDNRHLSRKELSIKYNVSLMTISRIIKKINTTKS